MISKGVKNHKKHTKLSKPEGGEFHRNEWAIIGAPCDIISNLATDLNAILSENHKLAFIDADHNRGRRKEKFALSYTDKISYQQVSFNQKPEQKQYRKYFNELDLVLINGNHFVGDKQIVIINDDKKESLSRKLDRLTDIRIILLERSSDDIHDFVMDIIKDKSEVQVFRLDQTEKIAKALATESKESTPPLFGLILSGGKSQRMGSDKGSIEYHGKAQREYEADLLSKFCHQTFISCRKNQDELIETKYSKIYDTFEGLGPYGGILSAFREHPNSAWLVAACDLPYLNQSMLKKIIQNRNPSKLASCFHNPETQFPEPLITIWEPRAYPVLLEFLSQGYSCPRKVLINSEIEELHIDNPEMLFNANDKQDYEMAIQNISK